MRKDWSWYRLVAVGVLLFAAQAAIGAVVTIGSYSQSSRPFLGTEYENLRAKLSDPANFGPGGVVPGITFSFAPAIDPIDPAGLAGVGIFVVTEPSSLTNGEINALETYVRGGGSLMLVADSGGNTGISAMLNALDGGSLGANGGTNSGSGGAIVGAGLSTSGPFGAAAGTFGVSVHSIINPGSASNVIGRSDGAGGTPILIEILPGALEAGSGAVIAMGDVLFMDFFVSPPSLPAGPNNDLLPLNWFSRAAGAGATSVPEPTSILLIAAALLGLAMARRRSKRA